MIIEETAGPSGPPLAAPQPSEKRPLGRPKKPIRKGGPGRGHKGPRTGAVASTVTVPPPRPVTPSPGRQSTPPPAPPASQSSQADHPNVDFAVSTPSPSASRFEVDIPSPPGSSPVKLVEHLKRLAENDQVPRSRLIHCSRRLEVSLLSE